MARRWDTRPLKEQQRLQNVLLKQAILQMALAHIPLARQRLAAAGIDARTFGGLEELSRIPPAMRRDVIDPRRNPEGPRAVMLRGSVEAVKRFSDRRTVQKIFLARILGGEEVQERLVEAATRPIHLHLIDGPGGRIPVAYTRDDLELVARAGARLAALVGLEREDRLINVVPLAPSLDFWGIFYMAHGVGMSALHVRRDGQTLPQALWGFRDMQATAVALPANEAVRFPDAAREQELDLSRLHLLLAVGRSLSAEERAEVGEGLRAAGASEARIAAAYAPPESHVLWAECAVPAGRSETFGFHTFPDLGVVEVLSPETAAPIQEEAPGELVITPLVFRGSGLPRWRTGDLALGGLTTEPCPNCARTVPRVGPTILSDAWRREVSLNGRRTVVDLRDAGAAASERAREWQVELERTRYGDRLFIHLAASPDPGPMIDLYEDLRRLQEAPTQIVLADPTELAARLERAPRPWPRYVERGSAP